MRRIFLCSQDDCQVIQSGDGHAEGDACENCDARGVVELVAVSRDDIEGRSGEYIAAEIRRTFDGN
jgi:hypothetical protein